MPPTPNPSQEGHAQCPMPDAQFRSYQFPIPIIIVWGRLAEFSQLFH
ncbi:MAG: hypothetical protein F6J93_03285 [Oscillatoria sp. SIO1A7]|nr:hypothetical protein [Oscillatoria sp. SIO1A7]